MSLMDFVEGAEAETSSIPPELTELEVTPPDAARRESMCIAPDFSWTETYINPATGKLSAPVRVDVNDRIQLFRWGAASGISWKTEGSSSSTSGLRPGRINPDAWFERALVLDRHGKADDALDVVYLRFNELIHEGKISEIDSFLSRLNVESLPNRILLAIAIQTRPVGDKLNNRQRFFERTWKTLESRGKDAEKLLGRLRYAAHETPKVRPSGIRRFFR